MTTPTPAQITRAIEKAFAEDFDHTKYDSKEIPIPMRAHSIVRKAISQACDEVAA